MKLKLKKIISLVAVALIAVTAIIPAQAARATTTSVSGIPVYVTSSVSDSNYNTFISWVKNMPEYLRRNIKAINVVDDMTQYSATGSDASGLTNGKTIYIKASGLSGRQGSLYHEAGHVLDSVYGYSNTTYWKNICKAEWSGEGHYSTANESFAEAVSRYYTGEPLGSQSKKAIKNIINYGFVEGSNGLTATNITLYTNSKGTFLYPAPNDRGNYTLIIPTGSTIQATGINADKTWYQVNYKGTVGYVLASFVSTVRDSSIPFTKSVFINGTEKAIKCTSGTYAEICGYIKSLGYGSFTLKNNWGTTVYSYYKVTEDQPCYATDLQKGVVKTLSINGKSVKITCASKTYKEVFDYIKSLGYTSFTVKDAWGSTVYSWYGATELGTCSASDLSNVFTKTVSINGKTATVKCTSGTYKEVFNYINGLGYSNYTVKDSWGSTVYSWYSVTDSGKVTVTLK